MSEVECPADGCGFSSSERGVKTHWGRSHDEIAPWRKHTCDYCGDTFAASSGNRQNEETYCSISCSVSDRSHERDLVSVDCDSCGEAIMRYPSHIYERNFCSRSCHGDWIASLPEEESPAYKGGGKSRYYGAKWEEQRRKALNRDDFTCTYSDCERQQTQNGDPLHVHHIVPAREFDELSEAHELDNLRTLCAEHHAKVEP